MQETPRLVTSPDEREALEREMRQRTDLLGSLLVGYHIQQALDSAPLQAEQVQLVSQWPKLLKNHGLVKVWVRTSQGLMVPVWVTLAIVIRDAVVVLGALAYKGVAGHLEIQPTLLGKTYVFVEFAMLALVLGHAANLLPGEQWLVPMFALVFATTLASGIQYVWIWSGKARQAGSVAN